MIDLIYNYHISFIVYDVLVRTRGKKNNNNKFLNEKLPSRKVVVSCVFIYIIEND